MNRTNVITMLRRISSELATLADAVESSDSGSGGGYGNGGHRGRDDERAPDRDRRDSDRPGSDPRGRFCGFRLRSKFRGTCVVCGAAYQVGSPVLYNRDKKKSACVGCGEETD
jgi:hypothetical protein